MLPYSRYHWARVWILWCSIRYELRLKAFPHSLHPEGLYPGMDNLVLEKGGILAEGLSHTRCTYTASRPVHPLWWIVSCVLMLKAFSHIRGTRRVSLYESSDGK